MDQLCPKLRKYYLFLKLVHKVYFCKLHIILQSIHIKIQLLISLGLFLNPKIALRVWLVSPEASHVSVHDNRSYRCRYCTYSYSVIVSTVVLGFLSMRVWVQFLVSFFLCCFPLWYLFSSYFQIALGIV